MVAQRLPEHHFPSSALIMEKEEVGRAVDGRLWESLLPLLNWRQLGPPPHCRGVAGPLWPPGPATQSAITHTTPGPDLEIIGVTRSLLPAAEPSPGPPLWHRQGRWVGGQLGSACLGIGCQGCGVAPPSRRGARSNGMCCLPSRAGFKPT